MSSSDETRTSTESRQFMPGLFRVTEKGAALRVAKCSESGTYYFPYRELSGAVGPEGKTEEVWVSGAGTVYSSTIIRVPSPVGLKPPYAYGFVDLDQVPLRVHGLFCEGNPKDFAPGTKVHLVADTLKTNKGGEEIQAYKFALGSAQ